MIKNDVIYIRTPDGIHDNIGIELSSNNSVNIAAFFAFIVLHKNYKDFNGFEQGYTSRWRYYEFWVNKQDELMKIAEDVALSLNLPLDIR